MRELLPRSVKMKSERIHISALAFISAFVIGVILFTTFWKMLFGSASGLVVLAGVAGTAIAVIVIWLRHEIQHRKDQDQ